jgi:hypothetical protein
MPPVKSNLDTYYNHGDIRQAQKEQTQLANELGAGWPIEVAAKRVGISTEQAYTYIKADPQLQARIFQLRGHPLLGPEETVTAEEQLKQAKRESLPSILTLAMVRDNPEAKLETRVKASEILLKLNPDLVAAQKVEAEVVHRHVLELPQLSGLRELLQEANQPAIEAEYQEVKQ